MAIDGEECGREVAEAEAGICVLIDDIYLGMPRFMRNYAGLCGLMDLSCGNSVGFVRPNNSIAPSS